MNGLLAFRLSRRALGAVALEDDRILFADSRHLMSHPDRALSSGDRYIAQIVDQIRPSRLAAYVPDQPKGLTALVMEHLQQLAAASDRPLRIVTKAELLSAFAASPLRHRRELHRVVEGLWPTLSEVANPIKPYLADAAATAWYADVALELPDGT